jgi:4-diphosphocytidyl-2C-methyl-D-erythritol kinase
MAITIQTPIFVRIPIKGGVLVPLALFDSIKLEKTAKRQVAIIRKGGFRFPTNAQNQVYQVASALQRHVPGKTGVKITIQKNSPPNKGLGSWSSASAGTLIALNRLWGLKLSEKRLVDMACAINPTIAEILGTHFKNQKSKELDSKAWAIVVTPKLIEIDREWVLKLASKPGTSPETVVENHFPDLRMIREALAKAGWKDSGMSRLGPAVIGFSEKRIEIAKIPKNICSKLDFVWIGKACDGQFKLID